MTIIDILALILIPWAALKMNDLFRYEAFAEAMKAKRPRPHTFG